MHCDISVGAVIAVSFYAYWTPPSEFSEILLQRNMFNDHLPGSLRKAFKKLMIQEKLL